MDDRSVRLIPLGGLGEFGMNSMVVEWRDQRVLVDAGVMFPRTDLPGIDMIVPDFDYLANHREGTHAIILTHGHEDHIGALVFALQAISTPVYGTPFTLALAQRRLRDHGVSADLRPLTPGTPIDLGPFKVHPIRVAHSIPDSVALAIETPAGTVLSSADFKLRGGASPIEQTDIETFEAWGRRGILALLLDSTNAEMHGQTPPEDTVLPAFEEVFDKTSGRVVVTCFATSMPRIERVARIAIAHGRQICFLGRRLAENAAIAGELGLLSLPPTALVAPEHASRIAPDRLAVFAAGSQGEPFSALSLLGSGEQRDLSIGADDTVVFSARTIPGSERSVSRLMGNLFRRGCDVVHAGTAAVHVSGHAYQDDLAALLAAVRPRHVVPIHGEYRMLARFARLAVERGFARERVHLIENGEVLVMNGDEARRADPISAGRLLLDGSSLEGVDEAIVRDRRHLSFGGIVVPIVVLDQQTGRLEAPPEIVTRGVTDANGGQLMQDAGRLVAAALASQPAEERGDPELTRERLRIELRRYFKKRLTTRPLILPVVMEV